jgi:S1-C subfamily serine protease
MYRRGLGVPEDADTGAIWLSKAMNTVASFAKSNLAWANNEGRVVPSFVTSFIDEMRDKANDVALAQWFIGMFYATGFCVPKDATKAVEWYRRAADQGEKSGQLYLGLRYADGVGIPKDEIEALAWLNISAASGSDDAARSRDLLERNLGRDMRLVAQQRSKEILKEIEATKGRSQSKDPYSAIAITVTSSGSGAIVSSQGLILSAAHVVKGATTVEVIMATGKRPAQVLRIDEPNDVALLKIGGGPYPALTIAPSRNVRLGQTVATIGFPNTSLQGFSPKVTRGEISSVNGYADDPRSWQISVPVQPGNSGGPLLDEDGTQGCGDHRRHAAECELRGEKRVCPRPIGALSRR